ncbi:CAMK CAMKL GIN4 kinase [Pyrrhoderma noxium]|uniref:non-specific serine/threonine protein kinase n=1 Tax=Pyrrhoderma noxium TaxID=2282107 RepID=A0A286UUJ3_9AGAM|nr:CAMK CAMKL GIN4 kinase [Pyrrhoderma noxium]
MVGNGGIGDFECLKVLGMGAHSIVNKYKVPSNLASSHRWKKLEGKEIAIKKIPIELENTINTERAAEEALPNCSGLLTCYGSTRDQSNYYILYELADHGNLLRYASTFQNITEQITIERFRSMLEKVSYGLKNLHNLEKRHRDGKIYQLVHQDIKPENIIISTMDSERFECCLGDFGSMYRVGMDPRPAKLLTSPYYAAPEQVKERPEYGRFESDIWSFGMTIISVSLGGDLFPSGTPIGVVFQAILDGSLRERVMQGSFLFNIPAAEDLILGMIEMDPKDRFTAKEVFNHPFTKNTHFTHPLRRTSARLDKKVGELDINKSRSHEVQDRSRPTPQNAPQNTTSSSKAPLISRTSSTHCTSTSRVDVSRAGKHSMPERLLKDNTKRPSTRPPTSPNRHPSVDRAVFPSERRDRKVQTRLMRQANSQKRPGSLSSSSVPVVNQNTLGANKYTINSKASSSINVLDHSSAKKQQQVLRTTSHSMTTRSKLARPSEPVVGHPERREKGGTTEKTGATDTIPRS